MGKFLHLYQTENSFETDYNGEAYVEPWVSYTEVEGAEHVDYNKPDPANGHCYVDLGLPSGTLWACTNLGAENPEDLGTDYKWGEVEAYDYDRPYKFSDPNTGDLTKYNHVDEKTILDLEDDAANATWGGEWHIPSYEQVYEMLENTTRSVSGQTQNGMYSAYVTFTSNINGNQLTFKIDDGGCLVWMNECDEFQAAAFCYGCEGSFGPRLSNDSGFRSSAYHNVRGVLGQLPEPGSIVHNFDYVDE